MANVRRIVDWDGAEVAYVTGFEVGDYQNQTETAKRLGITPSRLRDKAARDKWNDKRAAHIAAEQVELQKARARTNAKRADDLAEAGTALALAGMNAVTRRLRRAIDHANSMQTTEHDPGADIALDPLTLQRLGNAARQWQALATHALGGSVDAPVMDEARGLLRTQAEQNVKRDLAAYIERRNKQAS